jgi:hypothetical protein
VFSLISEVFSALGKTNHSLCTVGCVLSVCSHSGVGCGRVGARDKIGL